MSEITDRCTEVTFISEEHSDERALSAMAEILKTKEVTVILKSEGYKDYVFSIKDLVDDEKESFDD